MMPEPLFYSLWGGPFDGERRELEGTVWPMEIERPLPDEPTRFAVYRRDPLQDGMYVFASWRDDERKR
jgi:hypothetical protein